MKKGKASAPGHSAGLEEIAGNTKKIVLVVEDDATHRKFMEEILKDCGFSTIIAENGLIALAQLETGRHVDLIIMDWDMPSMNGLETVKNIRARQVHDGWPHIPVLAFTGNKLPGDREKCLAAGMDAYLPKEVWMPRWRQTLIKNLESLIAENFIPEEYKEEPAANASYPIHANFNLDEFNAAILQETRALLKSGFAETVQEYLEDATLYIARIKEGLAESDREKIAKGSHPLKSNSKGFGLMAVAGLAEAINIAALKASDAAETLDPVRVLLPQLLEAFSRAEKKLRAQL